MGTIPEKTTGSVNKTNPGSILAHIRELNKDNPKYSAMSDSELASVYKQRSGKSDLDSFLPKQAPVAQAQSFVKHLRELNAGNSKYEQMSDIDLAKLYKAKSGDNRLDDFIGSGSLLRGVSKFGTGWSEGVDYVLGEPTEEEGIMKGATRGLLEMLPEAAILGLGAAFTGPTAGYSDVAGLGLAGTLAGARQYARSGDVLSALVTGGAMSAGGALAKPLTAVGGKLLPGTVGKAVGKAGANFVGALPLVAAQELTAPTGTDADSSVLARASLNADRLLSKKELARVLGTTAVMIGTGEAGAIGVKSAMKRVAQRNKVLPVREEAGNKYVTYEDALAGLTQEGATVNTFNKPSTVLAVANKLGVEPGFTLEDANYHLALDRSTKEYTPPEDILTIRDYEQNIAPVKQARELEKILLAGSLRKTAPDVRGWQSLNAILNEEGLQNLIQDNPESYRNFSEGWEATPMASRGLLLKPYRLGPDASTLSSENLARRALQKFTSGELTAEQLAEIHPALASAAEFGNSATLDLFKNRKIFKNFGQDQIVATTPGGMQVTTGGRTEKQIKALRRALDKKSETYRSLGKVLDPKVPEAEGTRGLSFKHKIEDGDLGYKKFMYTTITLGDLTPEGKMPSLLFEHTQHGKAILLDLMSDLGQNAERTLPKETAFERAQDWLDGLSVLDKKKLALAFNEDYEAGHAGKGLVTDKRLASLGLSE